MTDISMLITMKIPNQIGPMPTACAIGKNTGTVIRMIDMHGFYAWLILFMTTCSVVRTSL